MHILEASRTTISTGRLVVDVSHASTQAEVGDAQQWTDILAALGCKWGYRIMSTIDEEALRFNEIKGEIDGLSSSALSERLTGLEEAGLVDRSVIDTPPPAVSYSLTDRGAKIGEMLNELEATWEQTK